MPDDAQPVTPAATPDFLFNVDFGVPVNAIPETAQAVAPAAVPAGNLFGQSVNSAPTYVTPAVAPQLVEPQTTAGRATSQEQPAPSTSNMVSIIVRILVWVTGVSTVAGIVGLCAALFTPGDLPEPLSSAAGTLGMVGGAGFLPAAFALRLLRGRMLRTKKIVALIVGVLIGVGISQSLLHAQPALSDLWVGLTPLPLTVIFLAGLVVASQNSTDDD